MPTLRWRRVEGVPYRWAPRGRSSASTAAVRLPWFRLGVSKMNSKANFRAAALARTLAVGLVAAALIAAPSQPAVAQARSEEHTSELQSLMAHLVCRLLLE